MSLENPNFFERVKAWPYLRITLVIGGLVVLLGGVLFTVQTCSNWSDEKQTKAKQANLNAAIDQLKQANVNVTIEKQAEQEAIANVRVAADDYLEAVNATDASREAVNQSIERMKQAANRNGNVNAKDVEEAMRGL